MKHFVLVSILSTLISEPFAAGATIERIAASGDVVVIRLSPAEAQNFAEGEVVTIQTRSSGEPIEGQIKKIKNGRAFVKVSKTNGMERGKNAEVAALGAGSFTGVVQNDGTSQARSKTPFREPLFHAFQVSPAQIYQVQGFRTDMSLGLTNDDWTYKVAGINAKLSQTGPKISAAAIKRVTPLSKVRLGLQIEREQTDLRFEIDTDFGFLDESGAMATNRAAPMVAYTLSNFSVGATYAVRQTRYDGDYFQTEHSFSYGHAEVGALYFDRSTEAGIYIKTKVDETSKGQAEDGSDVEEKIEEPLTVGVHGRRQLTPQTAVHTRVEFLQNNAFNTAPEEPDYKNNWTLEAGIRQKMQGKAFFDAIAYGRTPAYVNDKEKSPTTIVTYGAGVGYYFPYASRHLIGAALGYERGTDEFKDEAKDRIKLSRDTLTIGVQGAIAL